MGATKPPSTASPSTSTTTATPAPPSGSTSSTAAGRSNGSTFHGRFYNVDDNILSPKPMSRRTYSRAPEGLTRPTLYAGGESETAKNLIAAKCDAYLMHGDDPSTIAAKVADMRSAAPSTRPPATHLRRHRLLHRPRLREPKRNREVDRITAQPDPTQSPAGFANFQQWITGSQLEKKLSLRDYSVSNRGLYSGLIGTPEHVKQRSPTSKALAVLSSSCKAPRSTTKWPDSPRRLCTEKFEQVLY